MIKRIIISTLAIVAVVVSLCGCGVTSNGSIWGTDYYKSKSGKTYIVFTTTDGGIFVIEEKEE